MPRLSRLLFEVFVVTKISSEVRMLQCTVEQTTKVPRAAVERTFGGSAKDRVSVSTGGGGAGSSRFPCRR